MSPSSLTLMKRIFLTLGILFFAGGTYYLGQNYTIVQFNDDQIARINTGLESSVLGQVMGESASSESELVLRVGSFALIKR